MVVSGQQRSAVLCTRHAGTLLTAIGRARPQDTASPVCLRRHVTSPALWCGLRRQRASDPTGEEGLASQASLNRFQVGNIGYLRVLRVCKRRLSLSVGRGMFPFMPGWVHTAAWSHRFVLLQRCQQGARQPWNISSGTGQSADAARPCRGLRTRSAPARRAFWSGSRMLG